MGMEIIKYHEIIPALNLKPDESSLDKYLDHLCLDPEWFAEDIVIFERLATVESFEERTGEYEIGFNVSYKLIVSGDVETHTLSCAPQVGARGILMPDGNVVFDLPEGFHSHFSDKLENVFPAPPAYSFYAHNTGTPPDPTSYGAFLKLAEQLHAKKTHGQESLPSGAFLFGKSFTGKTTSVMHFLIKWATLHTFKLGFHSSKEQNQFQLCYRWLEASEFAELAKNKAKYGQTMEWIAELVSVKILIIDDMDKFQLSESVEVAFFDVLKRRIEWGQGFTIITSNQSMEKFVSRFAYDRRAPIENRMRTFYRPFQFKANE